MRLCKGAYQEPPTVAFPDKRDVDRSYAELMEMPLERGNYPGIATHDEALIARAKRFVQARTQWYPYLMRPLAERPANIAFILGNVIREGARA